MLWVITYMHRNSGYKTKIKPQPRKDFNNNNIEIEVGLFSSRAPHRPNPVAISALKINKIDHHEGYILTPLRARSYLTRILHLSRQNTCLRS